MTLGLCFWICMLLWLLLGAAPLMRSGEKNWGGIGLALLPWCAVAVVGWAVFGPAIKG